MASKLSQVTKGKLKKPYVVVVYGPDGVGKSTFGSEAPKPIFLGPEQGSNNLDVARFPAPSNWADVIASVKELLDDQHDFQTLVIDSLDWMEPLVQKKVCDDYGVNSIEKAAQGYGKGYGEASQEWIQLKDLLNELREKKKMHIVLIAHCEVIKFNDPENQVVYDRYQLKLRPKDSAMFREYADAVLFANYETLTLTEGKQIKAVSEGARVCRTERRPGFDAKNRLGLPEKMRLKWDDFKLAADRGEPEKPAAIRARIEGMLTAVTDPALKAAVETFVKDAGDDVGKLTAAEIKLKTKLG